MKPRNLDEALAMWWWGEVQDAPAQHSAETPLCFGWKALEDYADTLKEDDSRPCTLNIAHLQHLRGCRYCKVRLYAFAEPMTQAEVDRQVEQHWQAAQELAAAAAQSGMAVQFTKPQPPDQWQQSPVGAAPAFAGRVLSSRRKSADAAVEAKTAQDTFIWKRESGTVNGWLSFETWDGETFQPHVELKPPPGKTTFLFRYEKDGAKEEITLTIDSDGHSEPCEDVPAESLKDWELVAPDGELEWKAASESPS